MGLALVLGALAAADVSRREAALRARLAPLVPVLNTLISELRFGVRVWKSSVHTHWDRPTSFSPRVKGTVCSRRNSSTSSTTDANA